MWLIDTTTVELVHFIGEVPPYAILSHTWGDEEVIFQDLRGGEPNGVTGKKGYAKIRGTCREARRSGIGWAWVDTCCIDKTSSAELSEAINSMFQWYENAMVCYAYLADVDDGGDQAQFSSSRWFTRGWTLQELLAPASIMFYTASWHCIGDLSQLNDEVSRVTGIEKHYLLHVVGIDRASVAQRMSWASRRKTTRLEDVAYCLLGIFGVNLPLIYGEGKKAFLRLQDEIMKSSIDQSIFAWSYGMRLFDGTYQCLATGPEKFAHAGDIIPCRTDSSNAVYEVSSKHIALTAPLCYRANPTGYSSNRYYIPLSCRPRDEPLRLLAIPVVHHETVLFRVDDEILLVPREVWTHESPKQLHIRRDEDLGALLANEQAPMYALRRLPAELEVLEMWPPEQWVRPQSGGTVWTASTDTGYARLRWTPTGVDSQQSDPSQAATELLLKLDAAGQECSLAEFPATTLAELVSQPQRYPSRFDKTVTIGLTSLDVEVHPSFQNQGGETDLYIIDLVSSLCPPWSIDTHLQETSGLVLCRDETVPTSLMD